MAPFSRVASPFQLSVACGIGHGYLAFSDIDIADVIAFGAFLKDPFLGITGRQRIAFAQSVFGSGIGCVGLDRVVSLGHLVKEVAERVQGWIFRTQGNGEGIAASSSVVKLISSVCSLLVNDDTALPSRERERIFPSPSIFPVKVAVLASAGLSSLRIAAISSAVKSREKESFVTRTSSSSKAWKGLG